MKRYSMQYESDQVICRSNIHTFAMASSFKTAKGYIARCMRLKAEFHPKNFKVFDHYADVDPATGYVPCVYEEA